MSLNYDRHIETAAKAAQAAVPLLGRTGGDLGRACVLLRAAVANLDAVEAHRSAVQATAEASDALSRAQGACLDALGNGGRCE